MLFVGCVCIALSYSVVRCLCVALFVECSVCNMSIYSVVSKYRISHTKFNISTSHGSAVHSLLVPLACMI